MTGCRGMTGLLITGRLVCLVAALVTGVGSATAETSGLEPLTRRDQLLGWEAVGRIDMDRGSFCTGTLVAPDLVLTAAHCVMDDQGKPIDPSAMTFQAGYAEGVAIARASVLRTVADPGYDPTSPVSAENVRHDVALLQLAQPIPAAVAAPYSVAEPGKGQAVSVVSYADGRAEMLSWQRECAVLERGEGLIATNCDVTFGASGAPVFDRTGARPRIVAIISAGGPTDRGQIAYGMELPAALRALKALLQAGKPFAEAGAAASPVAAAGVRRIGAGDGTSRDIGARFQKPKVTSP